MTCSNILPANEVGGGLEMFWELLVVGSKKKKEQQIRQIATDKLIDIFLIVSTCRYDTDNKLNLNIFLDIVLHTR